MLKKIEKLIPAALDAIDAHLLEEDSKGIPSGYQSAISGFGTSILQMGLVPTLAVYLDADNKADIDRKVLLNTLFSILLSEKDQLSTTAQDVMNTLTKDEGKNGKKDNDKEESKNREFLRSISQSAEVKRELKSKLMDAALAFKLAIRTYNLVKS